MTLGEFFEEESIDLEKVEERSGESSYWASCSSFIAERWDDDFEDLSVKQKDWAEKIREDMIEYRINNQPPAGMRSRF